MSTSFQRFSACMLLVTTLGGFVCAEESRFTPIKTLTVTQLNDALNANLREHFGHETFEMRIDPNFVKTDETGKIVSMKVPRYSIVHLAKDESAKVIDMLNTASADGPRWWVSENNREATKIGLTDKWRWESGIQIGLPSQPKRD